MSEIVAQDAALKPLLDKMVAAKQLSSTDAVMLLRQSQSGAPTPPSAEADVLRWLAQEYDLPYTTLEDIELDRQLISLFPARILLKEELLPLRRVNGSVEVATSRLFATQGLDALKTMTGLNLKPVLASSEAIQREMKKRLGVGADTLGTLGEDESFTVVDEHLEEDTDLDSAAEDASIIRFVNQVLRDAIELRASDIHLEPFEAEFRIRYRIDGVLQDVPVPSQIKRFQPAIVSRVKILSHLNIAEKRLPQDGRIKIKMKLAGKVKELDYRVSVLPTLFGEKIVCRLLDKDNLMLDMTKLGFERDSLQRFEKAILRPWGMVLVTGPTGSGKTNTLYSALSRINTPETNIMTAEDPVEFNLPGVNQVQMKDSIGLNFAAALRSFLRQDPNIILVGEIRDFETAEIAVKAALTGHLVLSTLHTNDAPSTINRLMNMGIEPYLVATSTVVIAAQRLIRRVCSNCKAPTEVAPQTLVSVGFTPEEAKSVQVMKGKGCERCNSTGYKGRVACVEVLDISDEIREMILSGASSVEIKRKGLEEGMVSLRRSGLQKIKDGMTTIEEVVRETVL